MEGGSIGFVRQEIAQPGRCGFVGVIVVHDRGRFAHLPGLAQLRRIGAQRVVEDEDAGRARMRLDQCLDFRRPGALALGVVEEIGDGAFMVDQFEPGAIERETLADRPGVVNFDLLARAVGSAAATATVCQFRRTRSGWPPVLRMVGESGDWVNFS